MSFKVLANRFGRSDTNGTCAGGRASIAQSAKCLLFCCVGALSECLCIVTTMCSVKLRSLATCERQRTTTINCGTFSCWLFCFDTLGARVFVILLFVACQANAAIVASLLCHLWLSTRHGEPRPAAFDKRAIAENLH